MSVFIVGGAAEGGEGAPRPPIDPHPSLALHAAMLAGPPAVPPEQVYAALLSALARTADAFREHPAMGDFIAVLTDPGLGPQFAAAFVAQLGAGLPRLALAIESG